MALCFLLRVRVMILGFSGFWVGGMVGHGFESFIWKISEVLRIINGLVYYVHFFSFVYILIRVSAPAGGGLSINQTFTTNDALCFSTFHLSKRLLVHLTET